MDVFARARMKRLARAAALALAGSVCAGAALACDDKYQVQPGDSLSAIADRIYQDADKWRDLYRDNQALVGEDPDVVLRGVTLRINCGDEDVPTRAATPTVTLAQPGRVNLVTADGFAPFTDRNLPQGGMIAELVRAAFAQVGRAQDVDISWINDRTAHLDPLLRDNIVDMAFPSYRPDCTAAPGALLCTDYLTSDPMFELLIVLFVDAARPVSFAQDTDIEGKTLCRPLGYALHDLDRPDRRWISDGKVVLRQPPHVQDCFAMLTKGEVDAVAINEFTGRGAMRDLGLGGQVEMSPGRPLSIEKMFVVIHKDHPEAEELLETINSGLQQIRANGEFQRVLDRHLLAFWGRL